MDGTLTHAVMAYKNSGKGWRELYERICLYSYEYPVKWSNWDEDRCSDFFLFFLPKLKGIVGRYQPVYSFETYLSCTIRWNMKTFIEKKSAYERYVAWSVKESEQQTSLAWLENPELGGDFEALIKDGSFEDECPFELDSEGRLGDWAFRRRLLFVILLKAADIPEDRIPVLAGLTGVDPEWLEEKTKRARGLVASKVDKREKLKRRRNECWYHLNGAKMLAASDGHGNPDSKPLLERRMHTWEKRYESACENLRHLNVSPSHEEIGRLLDVPPGTVSSGLFFVRKIWNDMESGLPVPQKLRLRNIPAQEQRTTHRIRPQRTVPKPQENVHSGN